MQARSSALRRLVGLMAWLAAGIAPVVTEAQQPPALSVVSSAADRVSGGDALVRVSVRAAVVTLNGADVTSSFHPDPSGAGLIGLVQGLRLGDNTLTARAGARRRGSS